MPKTKAYVSNDQHNKSLQPLRPALTPEARENQMISLAMDLVERRLREGTASSQETTHFLKLATTTAQLEKEKLMTENKLLQAKIDNLESQQSSSALYADALKAFSTYSGRKDEDPDETEQQN